MYFVHSQTELPTLESCREWVYDQVLKLESASIGYDYECAKNCSSNIIPYICEETIK